MEIQCLSSTESVTSSSAPSVPIQWMVQLPNSVYGVSIQCAPFNFCNHIGTQRGKGQWRDSIKPAFVQCISSVQSVCPKYLNEVAVLSQCTTASALAYALYGLTISVGIQ